MAEKVFKALRPPVIESGDQGEVLLTFAEYNVPDHDNDTFMPGSIPDGKVFISAYSHASSRLGGDLPVGVADVYSEGGKAYAKAQYNLRTPGGRDHYEMIKQAPELWEFSWGFDGVNYDWKPGYHGRTFRKVDQYEVCQVMRGAGKETGVISVKEQNALTPDEIRVLKEMVKRMSAESDEPADAPAETDAKSEVKSEQPEETKAETPPAPEPDADELPAELELKVLNAIAYMRGRA